MNGRAHGQAVFLAVERAVRRDTCQDRRIGPWGQTTGWRGGQVLRVGLLALLGTAALFTVVFCIPALPAAVQGGTLPIGWPADDEPANLDSQVDPYDSTKL